MPANQSIDNNAGNNIPFSGFSIRFKAIGLLVLIVTFILAVFVTYYYFTTKSEKMAQLSKFADLSSRRLASSISYTLWNISKREADFLIRSEMANQDIAAIIVYDENQSEYFVSFSKDSEDLLIPFDKKNLEKDLIKRTRVIKKNGRKLGSLSVYYTPEYFKKDLHNAILNFVYGIMIIDLVLIIILSSLVRRIFIRPLMLFYEFSEKISKGDLDATLEIKTHDEIGFVSNSLNRMAKDLKDSNLQLLDTFNTLKKSEEEKRKSQEHAAEQEKFALIGQIAGKMAHDFNNVLGAIMGNTELTLLDCKDEDIRETLKLILGQTERGKNLTMNLIAFAKDQEPKQEFFQISEKIDLAVSLLKKELGNITVTRNYELGMAELLADPGMIEHTLINLLQNSYHALMKNNLNPRISIQTYTRDEMICIEIEDNGCGIPKEHQGSIFTPSFTLKGSQDFTGSYQEGIKGTGYGMSNVKKYIEKHNGEITFKSDTEKGTIFILLLPIIKNDLSIKEKEQIHNKQVYKGKRILLVEDEQPISNVQFRILSGEPFNHHVDVACNGRMALDYFDKNTYDIISLDYFLPGDINGMDVYHHVRKKDENIPIIFVSGNIQFLESMRCLRSKDPKIDNLSKPCRNVMYVNKINEWLR